ncbi:MAG: type I methionyl aminopeptidase [Chloroflexota bacterium]
MAIHLKSQREISIMREAGRIVAVTLLELEAQARPGTTTADLDAVAERTARALGATPAFKGYLGYPASLCASINDEIVHGIPSAQRVLKAGDIVSLDFGVHYKGFVGDAAVTVGVGEIGARARKLLEVTRASLYAGIEKARAGRHLSDVSHAVEVAAEANGFSVVRQYVGHGVGRKMHEEPQVPNFGPAHQGPVLRPGMTFAIEPMLNTGREETEVRPDNWTVVTRDGGLSAHFEHTIAITDGEPIILTLP